MCRYSKLRLGRSHPLERPHQQSGDDEQHQARRHLRADEQAAGQRHPVTILRHVHGGHQAEERRGEKAHPDRERSDPPVRRGIHPQRRVGAQQDDLEHRPTDQEAAGGTDQREDEALGEELADQSRSTGTDRDPQRDLALPRGAAGEEQAAQVAARDHQDQQHQEAHQREHRIDAILKVRRRTGSARHRADALRVAARLAEQAFPFPHVVGMLQSQGRGERRQLGLGGARRCALRQPAPHADPAVLQTREVGEHLAAVDEARSAG